MLGAARSGALPRKDGDVPGRLQQGDLHVFDLQPALLAQRSIEIGPADQFAAENTLQKPAIARDYGRFSLDHPLHAVHGRVQGGPLIDGPHARRADLHRGEGGAQVMADGGQEGGVVGQAALGLEAGFLSQGMGANDGDAGLDHALTGDGDIEGEQHHGRCGRHDQRAGGVQRIDKEGGRQQEADLGREAGDHHGLAVRDSGNPQSGCARCVYDW